MNARSTSVYGWAAASSGVGNASGRPCRKRRNDSPPGAGQPLRPLVGLGHDRADRDLIAYGLSSHRDGRKRSR